MERLANPNQNPPLPIAKEKPILPRKVRREAMLKLYMSGSTYEEIGREFGVTRQRAQSIVRPRIQIIDALRRRAAGHCEECGLELTSNGHIHHLGRGTGCEPDDIRNLQYLCSSCHGVKESKIKVLLGLDTHCNPQ